MDHGPSPLFLSARPAKARIPRSLLQEPTKWTSFPHERTSGCRDMTHAPFSPPRRSRVARPVRTRSATLRWRSIESGRRPARTSNVIAISRVRSVRISSLEQIILDVVVAGAWSSTGGGDGACSTAGTSLRSTRNPSTGSRRVVSLGIAESPESDACPSGRIPRD